MNTPEKEATERQKVLQTQLDRAFFLLDEAEETQDPGNAFDILLDLATLPATDDDETHVIRRTAQFTLGELYWNGHFTAQDDKRAIYWYTMAGENGHPLAQFWLGNAYCTGQRAEQDHERAMYWYQKAAKQNVAWAQYHLAIYLSSGDQPDLPQALQWMEKAAKSDVVEAMIYVVQAYRNGLGCAKNDEIADAMEVDILNRHRDSFLKDARICLSIVREMLPGGNFRQDVPNAVSLLVSPVLQSNVEAQLLLYDLSGKVPLDDNIRNQAFTNLVRLSQTNERARSCVRLIQLQGRNGTKG